MNEAALQTLNKVFGYHEFRGNQAEVIDTLIGGDDCVVLMPTGGGKSLCFQIPAIVREGTAIVVSPLIALMQDQVSALQELGVRAAYLNSSLSYQEAYDVEQQLRFGELDLLYIAPERLMTDAFLSVLQHVNICLFEIDEAHCISQWGHDFRPEYYQLSILHQQFPRVPRVALTATADERTRQEIIERLGLAEAKLFLSSFDRPNIRYWVQEKNNARQQLIEFIKQNHPRDAGIVYCMSRKKVDNLAAALKAEGYDAHPYHAGMSQEVRQKNQDYFIKHDGVIIVATIAFGMGIDKPNVRFVAHVDLPKSVEAYYQETGRAGRDGLPSNAWMVYGLQDVILLRQMLAQSNAADLRKRVEHSKLEAMLAFCESTTCRRAHLLTYFDETSKAKCGNCDTCLEPVTTWNGTEAAQKALSTVYRTGQRFGVTYLIDILLGKKNDRVKDFGHDKLSTFGIGKDLDLYQWRSVFRQLVAHGLLNVDVDGFGNLLLTEKCRPILKGQSKLELRHDAKPKVRKTARSASFIEENLSTDERQLWEALRKCRQQLAEKQNVPSYVIFHDSTLIEMTKFKPGTTSELIRLNGVGERKLEKYGNAFLAIIADYRQTAA